jgi:Bacterial-like globin
MNGDGNGMDAYRAAGELAGITSLVDAFYVNMDTFPEARVIRKIHPDDLTESRKKLTYVLCGVLSGPGCLSNITAGSTSPIFIGNSLLELRSETHGCSACSMLLLFNPMKHHSKSF